MTTRLSDADALALHTQTSTTPGHTVAVLVLEASDQLSHERLHEVVASSLPQLARFRSRLVDKPFGVGQPIWAEIDDYDPSEQIHRATVPAPGGRRELAGLVTQLSAEAQDRRRPLWEAWSIDGLTLGRWALAIKMSPVLSDGSHGPSIWHRLTTTEPGSARDSRTEPGFGSTPSMGELLTDTLSEAVENQVTGAWMMADAVTGALLAVRRRVQKVTEPPEQPQAPPSRSGPVPIAVFNRPLTARRSTAFASIPLADVKAVSDAFGGSTANVLLAACTLSLRAWLQRHAVLPDQPLLVAVPLSIPAGDAAEVSTALGTGQVRMPVQLDDPVQILTNLHTATERMNIDNRDCDDSPMPAVDFATVVSLLPPWLTLAGKQVYSGLGLARWRSPGCHGTVSFAAERPGLAYCAGAEVIGMHYAEPLTEGCGLNITVTSHADVMDLCVSACPDNVPEVDDVASGIVEAVGLLRAAAGVSPRGEGPSVVTEMTSHGNKRARAYST
ncbi:wax ester/triacylglycerol synthase domain-containing protein [Mycobacterium deserti]|uniref:WS/DGAT domain-containing protein n=1 Tax=Mycobacterium deserti TaxID=2978347 RepID=A0ABT2M7S3_9MYCO|nr:wax ester/triacylglycerol synthase domain-containing protein [Mycobacterium deserti]MCT7658312.1 WS/DGAT domain-containing protein [Mycobacterium deserti]